MASLYDLSEKYLSVYDMTDLDEETLRDTLESIDEEIEFKAENYAKLIKNLEGDIAAFKDEEARLAGKRKTAEKKIQTLKDTLENAMEALDKTKFKSGSFSFNISKNPQSVNILDQKAVPFDYFTVPTPMLDKRAILADLKEGKIIDGVELKQTKSLKIK